MHGGVKKCLLTAPFLLMMSNSSLISFKTQEGQFQIETYIHTDEGFKSMNTSPASILHANYFFFFQTLESLTAIIRLMGSKHIGMIRYKVVNTLRIGLQITDRAFQEISCKAWNCFVKR